MRAAWTWVRSQIAGLISDRSIAAMVIAQTALKSLTVHSLGAHGTTTQDPALSPNLHSDIVGDVKKLTVLNDVTGGVTFAIAGRIGPVTIGGNLEDSSITAAWRAATAKPSRRCRHPELTIGRQCDRLRTSSPATI
jgi:hypothetical protein